MAITVNGVELYDVDAWRVVADVRIVQMVN
jgi:hypothetical protein